VNTNRFTSVAAAAVDMLRTSIFRNFTNGSSPSDSGSEMKSSASR
jgi:hypothetical protein